MIPLAPAQARQSLPGTSGAGADPFGYGIGGTQANPTRSAPAPAPVPGQLPLASGTQGPPPSPTPVSPIAGGIRRVPGGVPADAKGGQVPLSSSPAAQPSAPSPTPIPLATAPGGSPYATMNDNKPGGAFDYLTKTIAPGPGTDRLALAKSNFQNFSDSTDPEFKASLRDASTQAAGAGQIGSGMARGRLGDIGLARTRDLETAKTGFLNDATAGSIEDAYRNVGIAQQQQGFQGDQQKTAFDQAQRQSQLDEALRNGDFARYIAILQAGESGNPSDTGLALSGYYGNQAGAAGASAADLFKNSYASKALA